jgi:hypothetical protein
VNVNGLGRRPTSVRIAAARAARFAVSLLAACLVIAAASPGRATDAGPRITLDAEALELAGLEFATAATGRFAPELRGFGRVLDPSAIGDAVAGRAAARALDAAASAELARVEELSRDQQNASRRELETARAAAARSRADLSIAHGRLVAVVGSALAHDPELDTIARRLVDREAALVRVDVPGDAPRPAPELGVTLTTYPASAVLEARYVGPAPSVDPSLPGWGLLFLVTSDAPPPGTSVVARVRTGGDEQVGVLVPGSALVHHASRTFVYVAHEPGNFERRAVDAIALDDGSYFVGQGLAVGEQIVSSGAQQLLSTEIVGASADE